MLRKLKIHIRAKITLSVTLSMSVFAMAACIIRTVEARSIGSKNDYTYRTSMFALWVTVESSIVVIAASIPTLRPLYLFVHRRPSTARSAAGSVHSAQMNGPIRCILECETGSHVVGSNQIAPHTQYCSHPSVVLEPHPGTIIRTVSVCVTTIVRNQAESGTDQLGTQVTTRTTTDHGDTHAARLYSETKDEESSPEKQGIAFPNVSNKA